MKTSQNFMSKVAVVIFAVCPAISFAATPPTTSAYSTDVTQSYVEDQTTNVMANLNSILCTISSFDGSDMVNLGAYVALSDQTVCGGNSGSTNTGSKYMPAVVNSTRANNSSPMILKAWLNPGGGDVQAVLSLTQAPTTGNPYGLFRMDFCQSNTGSCDGGEGFINSDANGLAFYSYSANSQNNGPNTDTTA